tara:strand:+ start:1854 stop:2486 length:633 start_codon:yes stop_codon:yes gene_type:complete
MKKTIIFDFDGVIIDSSSIKADAFNKLFSRYGKSIGIKARNYHIENEGIPRIEKFNYINKYLLNSIKKHSLDELNKKYSKIVLDKILKKNLSYGFKKFLNKFNQEINFYISSSAPGNELNYIIKNKKINNFFKVISGYPPKKNIQIKKILINDKLNTKNVYYVGDTEHDYKISKKLNLNFIGYIRYGNKFKHRNINMVNSFNEIAKYIKK